MITLIQSYLLPFSFSIFPLCRSPWRAFFNFRSIFILTETLFTPPHCLTPTRLDFDLEAELWLKSTNRDWKSRILSRIPKHLIRGPFASLCRSLWQGLRTDADSLAKGLVDALSSNAKSGWCWLHDRHVFAGLGCSATCIKTVGSPPKSNDKIPEESSVILAVFVFIFIFYIFFFLIFYRVILSCRSLWEGLRSRPVLRKAPLEITR